MATGPEHYRKAEEWLEIAQTAHDNDDWEVVTSLHAAAQAHATLALAAATALNGMSRSPKVTETLRQWEAIAVERDA